MTPGQRCALFDLGTVAAGGKIGVSSTVDVELSAINHVIFPDEIGTLADIPGALRAQYPEDSARYNYASPFMQETVAQIVGDETNPYRIARRIYGHIIDRLHYQMTGGWDIPQVVLQRGSGSCSEYAYTFSVVPSASS